MKRKTKLLISALSLMLLVALSMSVATFSFADEEDATEGLQIEEAYVQGGVTAQTETNVDLIIENSLDTSTDEGFDGQYHIVEISSGAASNLGTYVSDGNFAQYVLTGNRTLPLLQDKEMDASKIDFKFFTLADAKKEENLGIINKADLIYVSNVSGSAFSSSNDMSEDLYDVLHTYALGSYKPLIIDNPTSKSNNNNTPSGKKSLANLATNIYNKSGYYYYTFNWDTTVSTDAFLGHGSGSLYIGINGSEKQAKWVDITDGTNTGKMAKVLAVSENGSDMARAFKLIADSEEGAKVEGFHLDGNNTALEKVYTPSASMLSSGYNSRYKATPNYIQIVTTTLGSLADDSVDFDDYDMIVLEDSVAGNVDTAIYKRLSSAMYDKKHIVYNSTAMGGTGSSGSDSTSTVGSMATKYEQLFYLCAYADYTAKYDSIMVTNRPTFDEIVTSSDTSTGKVIADLINRSNYRGNGGSGGSSSSKFTVLEIQPCYPIDRKVAKNVGKTTTGARTSDSLFQTAVKNIGGESDNYYTKPAQVKDGITLEEIYAGADQLGDNYDSTNPAGIDGFNLTDEYYAWEVTPAKIADALDLNVNSINVVHMSSEEMASYKGDILGNYDLIYIGGNTSALKEPKEFGAFFTLCNQAIDRKGYLDEEALKKMPIYTMYSHFGDFVHVEGTGWTRSGDNADSGTPVAKVKVNGSYVDTFATLNGNDISYVNYTNLKAYIDAGMPIIVTSEVAGAYDAISGDNGKTPAGYLQNTIDPDCNMYKILKDIKARTKSTTTKSSVYWNMDSKKSVLRDTDGGRLGTSLSGLVRVWSGKVKEADEEYTAFGDYVTLKAINPVRKLYDDAKKRPILLVKSAPATYNQHDANTKLTGTQTWSYKVSGSSNYEVKLIIDDNGNSKFDDGAVATGGNGSTKVTWDPGDFFGPFYWQLKVTDKDSNVVSSVTGIGYIKNKTNSKQTIKIMQLLPSDTEGKSAQGAQGTNTLYFCTMCEQSSHILHYNAQDGSGDQFNRAYEGLYVGGNGHYNKVYYGKHEHQFGIVKYDNNLVYSDNSNPTDSTTGKPRPGVDDWNDNLADQVSDLYDFDIDIYERKEFEKMVSEVKKAYDFSDWSAAKKQDKIDSFAIASGDEGYEEYNNLTTDQERLEFIMQREYAELALMYKQKYDNMKKNEGTVVLDSGKTIPTTYSAEKVLKEAISLMANGVSNADSGFASRYAAYGQWIVDSGRYSDFYNTVITRGSIQASVEYTETKSYEAWNSWSGVVIGGEYYAPEDKALNGAVFSDGSTFGRFVVFDNPAGGLVADTHKYHCFYKDIFAPYIEAKDLELEYKEEYEKYLRFSYGNDVTWLKEMYNCIIIGPADNFNNDDFYSVDSLDTLEYYAKKGGNMLLFHDLLSKQANNGSFRFTQRMKSYFAMDRNKATATVKSGEYYVNYTTPDSNKYFISNMSYKTTDDKYSTWTKDMNDAHAMWMPGDGWDKESSYQKYLTATQYTDLVAMSNDGSGNNVGALAYRYADADWGYMAAWNHSHPFDSRDSTTSTGKANTFGTNRASKNNDGIITLFPFTLADELYIGGTHSQAYAIDVEDPNTTVWYSLAGADNKKQGSSYYAADPRDGIDNYFIYSYGNVSFCGAGHSFVTGPGRNNNDERMLYINIICNSVRKSVNTPTIKIYDYRTDTEEKNEVIKEVVGDDAADYEMIVKSTDSYPEFSFKITNEQGVELKDVRIYYDLDYSASNTLNEYSTDTFDADSTTGIKYAKHEVIGHWNDDSIKDDEVALGALKKVPRSLKEKIDTDGLHNLRIYHDDERWNDELDNEPEGFYPTALKLKPRYFGYYSNEYTYIVVAAEYYDTEAKAKATIYKRLRIKVLPYLYDLT